MPMISSFYGIVIKMYFKQEVIFIFYKVKSVKPLDNFILLITFENGEKKKYDVKPLFNKIPIFHDLVDIMLFSKVKVDIGGYGISWNDSIDLSCNELWNNGIY